MYRRKNPRLTLQKIKTSTKDKGKNIRKSHATFVKNHGIPGIDVKAEKQLGRERNYQKRVYVPNVKNLGHETIVRKDNYIG